MIYLSRSEGSDRDFGASNRLHDMRREAIYFRGCYDSVGYLKKQGFYNGLTEKKRRYVSVDAVFTYGY